MLYPEIYPTLKFLLQRDKDLPNHTIPEDVLMAYHTSLMKHIAAVQEAGDKLGLSKMQLAVHDASKFTRAEFNAYAMHFHGGGAPKLFAKAWLHHIHNNPHHWQYWMFADGFSPKESDVEAGLVEMPENYALEMIADWIGASVAYTGSDDMTMWLKSNMPKIWLHSRTAVFVRKTLVELGYASMLEVTGFKNEVVDASTNV